MTPPKSQSTASGGVAWLIFMVIASSFLVPAAVGPYVALS
jgi:hypothetical protein